MTLTAQDEFQAAPGSVVQVRDEEWLVTEVVRDGDGWLVHCQGLTELVRDTTAIFATVLDEVITLDPADAVVVPDTSPSFTRSRLWLEAILRKSPVPLTDPELSVATRGLADPLGYQQAAVRKALDPDNLRPRILLADAVGLGKTLDARGRTRMRKTKTLTTTRTPQRQSAFDSGAMSNTYLLIIGDREALAWVLSTQKMAFPGLGRAEVRALAPDDELLIYTTRGCFKNPTGDRGRVIGTATVRNAVRALDEPVRFAERTYSVGCDLRVGGLAPRGEGVVLADMTESLERFAAKPAWAALLRRPLLALSASDADLIRDELRAHLSTRRNSLPGYERWGRRASSGLRALDRRDQLP